MTNKRVCANNRDLPAKAYRIRHLAEALLHLERDDACSDARGIIAEEVFSSACELSDVLDLTQKNEVSK
jgi:hypothetical protein